MRCHVVATRRPKETAHAVATRRSKETAAAPAPEKAPSLEEKKRNIFYITPKSLVASPDIIQVIKFAPVECAGNRLALARGGGPSQTLVHALVGYDSHTQSGGDRAGHFNSNEKAMVVGYDSHSEGDHARKKKSSIHEITKDANGCGSWLASSKVRCAG